MTATPTSSDAGPEIGTLPLLVALLGAPVVWVIHLAASYFLVALDCGSKWDGAQAAILLTTVLCAVAAGGAGVFAWGRWRRAGGRQDRHLFESAHVREFLLFSGAVLAALFAGAIVVTGIAPLFVPLCG
jgi:hypothetical protein